ncbi:MAG: redox-sensing transcriptional repressor Rex, partial [bacterium]|nr:redox-sensing transcriptional repressor Rex [bacterium]
HIDAFLDTGDCERIALVGVGNLGRALLSYFVGRGPQFTITAAFDQDPDRVNRVINGCRCYPVEQLAEVIEEQDIQLGLIAVPAGQAQDTANQLCRAGVAGLLNFAPVRVWVPEGVYVENVDVSMSLERVAYFARPSEPVRSTANRS